MRGEGGLAGEGRVCMSSSTVLKISQKRKGIQLAIAKVEGPATVSCSLRDII